MERIWLEAESFDTLGGWVIDQQSMEQMGSAYVMAHGMGTPVVNAETVCRIPRRGRYIVWARTRDWTAVWKRGQPAGRFQVIVNDAPLPKVLGTNGPDWSWQKAGAVEIEAGEAKIALRDLTGFNGRCDALYLTTDADEIPPNDPESLAKMRREVTGVVLEDHPTEYDLIVAGGGIAGVCTAIAALRSGAKVALLHDRPMLGGCNSSEIRVSMGGVTHVGLYPNLGNVVRELAPAFGANGSFLKNHSHRKDEWAREDLTWVSPLGGIRETCRVVGDSILTQNDIEENVIHEDATAPITWNFDLHFPDPENEEKFDEPFRSYAYHRGIPTPYPVPFRCLYARDVANLFLGGRHISMSHIAFASARVMRILGMLGEVVGLAAGICTEKNITPREPYKNHLGALKEKLTAGVPSPAVAYHSGGGNKDSESYHFKDTGHLGISPKRDEEKLNDPQIAQRIAKLHVTHKKR